ncbi:MAG: quinone oxidoreductase [Kofleriaceae bacterium]|nr:quinone oxidoreductase [Myxococcales bacterium]MCB9565141.1 quinone oxidoreductase [Kofleriaceae bacterium]MCB9572210.1 quinone oxidoreductase [Kofleriaceae bacterium]
MHAIRVHEPGGPERLQLDELSTPAPGPGQALVRVDFAGVNYIDVYHRTGLYPLPRPIALGREGAGVVEAVGAGAALVPGTRVAWTSVAGSYATHVIAPAEQLVPVPDTLDSRAAAALMLQGLTAHYLTRSTFPLAAGHTCLVHAAAGGAGLLIVQLARRAGATVIGTVSTEAKAARARAAGCHHVIRYTEVDFADEARRLTDGRGVDVVYDAVGRTTFLRGLDALRPRGMMVLFGQASGPVEPFDLQLLNRKGSLFVTRPTLFDHVATRDELRARAGDVLGWAARGELAVTIDRVVPLAAAADAHRALEARATIGKVLLDATTTTAA